MMRCYMTSTNFRHFLQVYDCHDLLREHLEKEFQGWIDHELEFHMMELISECSDNALASAIYNYNVKENWLITNYISSRCMSLNKVAQHFLEKHLPEYALELLFKDQDLLRARSFYLEKLTKSVVHKHLPELVRTQARLSHLRKSEKKQFNSKLNELRVSRKLSEILVCLNKCITNDSSEVAIVTSSSNIVLFPGSRLST